MPAVSGRRDGNIAPAQGRNGSKVSVNDFPRLSAAGGSGRSGVKAGPSTHVCNLCLAAVEAFELAQTGHDRSWPSPASLRSAAFGGTSAGVTFRSLTGGF